jgi:hypothetical protein
LDFLKYLCTSSPDVWGNKDNIQKQEILNLKI